MDPFLTPPEVFVKDYLTSYQLTADLYRKVRNTSPHWRVTK